MQSDSLIFLQNILGIRWLLTKVFQTFIIVAQWGHGSVVERCFRMAQAAVRFRLAPTKEVVFMATFFYVR